MYIIVNSSHSDEKILTDIKAVIPDSLGIRYCRDGKEDEYIFYKDVKSITIVPSS